MTNPSSSGKGLTGLGKLISVVLVLGLIGLGAWIVLRESHQKPAATPPSASAGTAAPVKFDTSDLADTQTSVDHLDPPGAYVPKNNILDIEISQYAGYAGLIAANGGLEPNDNSYFNTKYKFKVHLTINENEDWSALNSGKLAASATTADVLAIYGRQFQVVVPAQIGYSRGADALLVRSDVKKVNDLKGKIVSAAQFTESDFFIRYLAKEAGIDIKMMSGLDSPLDPEAINVIYCKDGLPAGDFFVKALNAGSRTIAGCVTWAPKTTDIPVETKGGAKLLISNRNLLIIADILIVNRGFAEKNPAMVAGLVDGLLYGNNLVRTEPDANADLIGKVFNWNHERTLAELKKVHLANLPEQLAFFSGGITQGGSFASIYSSAVIDYGNELIPDAANPDSFLSLAPLNQIAASGAYANQTAEIKPLASGAAPVSEADPVLSKDIRFMFNMNSYDLDMTNADNLKGLNAIKQILDVSPGSHVILVGHVDPTGINKIRQENGEDGVRAAALVAMELSKNRANEVMKQVIAHEHVDPQRVSISYKGWTQPVSTTNGDLNRRVEVQWFTLE